MTTQPPRTNAEVPEGGRRHAALRQNLGHLQALIDALHAAAPSEGIEDRELALLAGRVSAGGAEQRLRAVGALLATLDTYQRSRRPHRRERSIPDAGGRPAASGEDTRRPAPDPAVVGPAPQLAASAARYIARDLAARRLTEFTSAEAYRLARALARIGDVSAEVEASLGEANTIRLHPPPLRDAVSHSAV